MYLREEGEGRRGGSRRQHGGLISVRLAPWRSRVDELLFFLEDFTNTSHTDAVNADIFSQIFGVETSVDVSMGLNVIRRETTIGFSLQNRTSEVVSDSASRLIPRQ